MARNNHSIGNAGEFYVLAQLAQRGYIAGKTDDGQTLIDVIATDPETLKTVNIQVKSTAQFTGYWMTGNKARKSFESLWYVFVLLKSPAEIPEFFVFHSAEVAADVHVAVISAFLVTTASAVLALVTCDLGVEQRQRHL